MTENVKYNFIMAFQNFLSLEGGGNFYHFHCTDPSGDSKVGDEPRKDLKAFASNRA